MTLERLAPFIFVILWSTGWIAPVYIIPHASAEVFLSVRFACAALVFLLITVAGRVPFPNDRAVLFHALVSGFFLHGIYLGGVWWAIVDGVPASLSGIIAALQPVITAAIACLFLQERLSVLQRTGLFLGFAGIMLALAPTFSGLSGDMLATKGLPIIVNVAAMLGVVIGTLYQKRFLQQGDMRPLAAVQYLGGLMVVLPAALVIGDWRFDMSLPLLAVLAWSVLALSVVSIGLLLYLIRRGQVARAASLNYLMPPVVAIQAMILFGEHLSRAMIFGTLVAVTGVYLINRKTV